MTIRSLLQHLGVDVEGKTITVDGVDVESGDLAVNQLQPQGGAGWEDVNDQAVAAHALEGLRDVQAQQVQEPG